MDKKQHLIDVQTIRSKEQIEDIKWSLKRHCSDRGYNKKTSSTTCERGQYTLKGYFHFNTLET